MNTGFSGSDPAHCRDARAVRPTAQRHATTAAVVLLTCALAGCSIPQRTPQQPATPAQWHNAPASRTAGSANMLPDASAPWWQAFGDAQLDAVMALAAQRNTDLASAALRLRNALLRADASGSALLPSLSGNLGAGASKNLKGNQPWGYSYSSGLSVGWELDLWGKLAAQRDMALWEAQASEADRQALTLSTQASVARQYWQLAAADARIASSRRGLEVAGETLRISRSQYKAGVISGLDMEQAEQAIATQESGLLQLQHQRKELAYALSLLLDMPPGELPPAAQSPRLPPGVEALPVIQAGVPAQVIARRPDLQAALLRLQSSHINIDVVKRGFLPGISLSAGVNTSSSVLRNLLQNPSGSLGLSISLPFLNFGEMRRNPKIAQNDYELAVLAYRQAVFKALSEVETSLSNLHSLYAQIGLQQGTLERTRRIERMTAVRYRAGVIALRQWLDAQEAVRQAELANIDLRLNYAQTLVGAYQALGGAVQS